MPKATTSELRVMFISQYPKTLRLVLDTWTELRAARDLESAEFFSQLAMQQFYNTVQQLYLSASALNFNALAHYLKTLVQLLHQYSSNAAATAAASAAASSEPRFGIEVDFVLNQLISAAQTQPDPMLAYSVIDISQHPQLANNIQPASGSKETIEDLHDIGAILEQDIVIAVIDDDVAVSQALTKLLESFNFRVQTFTSIAAFLERDVQFYSSSPPHLILLDIMMPDVSETQVFEFALAMREQAIKVICLSGLSSYETRLKAVRAGLNDYIVKPVNVTVLVSKIRKSFHLDSHKPMYIMMLDDQPDVCDFYENAVSSPYLSIKAFSSVATFFKVLENFTPDIFLLDLTMPTISGLEVAKILRQQNKYDFIPIVFLTGDETEETKIRILDAGADDVIPKGTPIRMVMQHISTRTLRGQHIRYLTSRDSLTGVLNHGQIMDACANAFTLFQRNHQNFVIVLIDLDNFKDVNDTHGHPVGDKVLFGIGQLLHRSLRESDMVGRYGGEEFILLLHNTDTAQVIDKINDIRTTFNALSFKSNIGQFHVSFSAGLADAKDYKSLAELVHATDSALYQAKKQGRNRIVNANVVPPRIGAS